MTRDKYITNGIGRVCYSEAQLKEVKSLYKAGLSTRQVAEKTGVSKTYVNTICRDFSRTKSQANILRCPPTSLHWRSRRQAARKLVERSLGRKLSYDEHVHHINEDFTDNRLENLQVMSAKEPNNYHTKKRLERNGY